MLVWNSAGAELSRLLLALFLLLLTTVCVLLDETRRRLPFGR
jgi:hypothetical protein